MPRSIFLTIRFSIQQTCSNTLATELSISANSAGVIPGVAIASLILSASAKRMSVKANSVNRAETMTSPPKAIRR